MVNSASEFRVSDVWLMPLLGRIGMLEVVGKLEMPGTDRESLLVLLNNLRNNLVVCNEIVDGDKNDVNSISHATGVAIGRKAAADVDGVTT